MNKTRVVFLAIRMSLSLIPESPVSVCSQKGKKQGKCIFLFSDPYTNHTNIIHLFQVSFPVIKRFFQDIFLLFHFLSADCQHGGHLLELEAEMLQLKIEALTRFHLALPESETFLRADLSKNTAEELAYAEQAH